MLATREWTERVLTLKLKSQAEERVPTLTCLGYRFGLVALLSEQNGHTNIHGWPKKKKIIFLDSNQAHLLRGLEANVGRRGAGSSRGMGVPQNMNTTKSPLKGV